jgi:predicted Fe-S protein YdhL (DUF1289 family)
MPKPIPGDGVPSPCISVCKIDVATQLCEGCFRTLDEIALWSVLDDELRRSVWNAIGERRRVAAAMTPRKSE